MKPDYMKKQTPRGFKLWHIVPSSSGFGQWECNGSVYVKKDTIKPRPDLDGLIHSQTGKAVSALTWDGEEFIGMLPK